MKTSACREDRAWEERSIRRSKPLEIPLRTESRSASKSLANASLLRKLEIQIQELIWSP